MDLRTILFYKIILYCYIYRWRYTQFNGEFDSLIIYQEELTSDLYLEIQQFYIDFLLGKNAFVLSLYR